MRIVIYGIILALLFLAPVEQAEIANLEPIQAVFMGIEQGYVVLKTDTEDLGIGKTVEEALADMQQRSLGIVYLDTAEFLLVAENARESIDRMQPILKGSAKVCLWDGEGTVADAAKYMDSHKIGTRLDKWISSINLPKIKLETITK